MKVMTSKARRGAWLAVALLAAAGSASAQMYKWVDANGKTHFTETPPPATAKPAEMKGSAAGRTEVTLPYALATAVNASPVTLYTTAPCAGCDMGRTFLKNRGIPFAEKTVSTSADTEKLLQAGGDGSLPLLVVGGSKITGFLPANWTSALDAARYPAQKVLPSTYRYPAPQPAAPAVAKAAPAKEQAKEAVPARPQEVPPPRNAPPGFKF